MSDFEDHYKDIVRTILEHGEERHTRNGVTFGTSGFNHNLDLTTNHLPIITGRKIFVAGVLGEFAAFMRSPKHVDDFTKWGCNYWSKWADEDGSLNLDYGNLWFDYHGFNQWEWLVNEITHNPSSRRLVMYGSDPSNTSVSLPSCHVLYQFYVTGDGTLHLTWYQRSVDVMIGLPSDYLLATLMLEQMCRSTGRISGVISMLLGDCHIYEEHLEAAREYLETETYDLPTYSVIPTCDDPLFRPEWLSLYDYKHSPAIKFELKA